MKKFLVLVISIVFLSSCGNQEKLYIINWGEYMDPDIIADFEKEFNVKVIAEEVDSNEAMYSRIVSGVADYDIAVPSDYLAEKMISEELLLKIDYDTVDNSNINQRYYDIQAFDKNGEYVMPYFYGSVGIMYNKSLVDESDLQNWDILWNPKYKNQIYMYDSMRETIGIGLLKNGFSINSTNEKELEIAKSDLIAQKEVLAGYGTDDVKYSIQAGSAALGVVYSGDYLLLAEDDNLGFYIPESGTNIFVDNIVILKNGQNSELANEFINYISNYENSLRNSEYVGYSTVHEEVYAELQGRDNPLYTTAAYYLPETILEKSSVYLDLKEFNEIYADIYAEIKLK